MNKNLESCLQNKKLWEKVLYQKLEYLSKQTHKTLHKWRCIIKFFSNNSSSNNSMLVNSRMLNQSKLVFLVNYLQAIKYFQLKNGTKRKKRDKLKSNN